MTLRLLEDYVGGGVCIPANTHLAAICKIGDRLELQVRSLEMNGRIIPLALDAYDTDGLQGIYCPETSAAKSAKKASDDAISTAGQTFGGLVGDLASTVIRTGATIAKSASGEVSVNVVSGYEFYLVKAERR
ncbi:MAG: conjugative transposon protein TraM [Bacteroidales bacterium]|nr:conjugative transposon protein TraM [Bacteroidales bacterium]